MQENRQPDLRARTPLHIENHWVDTEALQASEQRLIVTGGLAECDVPGVRPSKQRDSKMGQVESVFAQPGPCAWSNNQGAQTSRGVPTVARRRLARVARGAAQVLEAQGPQAAGMPRGVMARGENEEEEGNRRD